MGSTIKSLKICKSSIDSLKGLLQDYYTKIGTANAALTAMMKGDGTNSYWEGQTAHDWYDSAITYLGKVCGNYSNSYKEFAKLCAMYDKANAKSKQKLTSAQIKAFANKFDGSSYTSGVKKDAEKYRISSVLGTVHTDAANDDQTKVAYKHYRDLYNALKAIATDYSKMGTVWTAVKNNTTGSMRTEAATRIKGTKDRKPEITKAYNDLEEYFIGDMLFSD